jgi:serine/threonine protein phosphatase PrpC
MYPGTAFTRSIGDGGGQLGRAGGRVGCLLGRLRALHAGLGHVTPSTGVLAAASTPGGSLMTSLPPPVPARAAAERIGVFAEPEVETRQLDISSSFLVLASDGVFEFLSSQSVVDMVGATLQMEQHCAASAAGWR